MKIKFLVIILGFIIVSTITAQDQVSLLEMDRVKEYLTLNADQYKTINIKVNQIKRILDEDQETIAALKVRFKSGDEPGFFEKIKVKRARDSRVNKIKDLLGDIKNQLNDDQKVKFFKMTKPELKGLKKEEIFEK
ncbi:MAG: hypothetical protein WCS69_00200 [Ignavibacteriaceae bacterium]|jgi:hypothetical protein